MPTKDKPKRSEVQTPGLYATPKQRSVSPSVARPMIEGRTMPGNIYVPGKTPSPKATISGTSDPTIVLNPIANALDKTDGQVDALNGEVDSLDNAGTPEILAATSPGFASNRTGGAESITEMARALKNDVDLIFNFVHDNIEFIPTFGSQKGALGTLIDGFGNAFDQAELMIALLRESGAYTCSFQFGELQLTAAQAAAWLGNDPTSIWAASNLLGNLGVPNETSWTGTEWVLRLSHCWVKVLIGGTYYHFDPAMKAYTKIDGIDLASAIGYNASSFMSSATSGATINSNYAQNMNRTNVRNNLATMASTLVTYIKTNAPTATVDDILGGRTINAQTTQLRQTSLPYLRPSTTPTTWTDIPNSYKATLGVLYDTINVSFYSKDIHGKRLTLFFNASHQAELRLDGTLIATSSAQTPGSWNSVLLSISHPYPYTWWDQSFWQTVWEGKPYLIAQAWGNAGRSMTELHREKLNQAVYNGSAADSEVVLGETLSVRWHAWNSQKSWTCDVFNRMTQCTTVLQHQVGMVGWYDTPLMDLGGIVWSSGALDNNYDNVNTNDTALAMHGIAFEAGTIEQICGIGGISSTTILDKAVQDGRKIYHGRSDNWSANVRPYLTNYDTQTLDDIENWYINYGWKVAIPEDGNVAVQDFRGFGYYAISPWQGAIGIFSGYLKGGMGAIALTIGNMVPKTGGASVNPSSDTQPHCTNNVSADPIDMYRGTYLYRNQDITVGSGSNPYSLTFERFYNSGARLAKGPLGLGWNHNWNHSLSVNSDGLLAMANASPLAGAAGLVAMFVTVDLYRDLTKPIDKWVTVALTNRWLLDQSRDNTVVVSTPGDTQVFVKQPNGTYIAPAGEPVTLVKNVGGDWTYTNKHKVQTNYDSAGKITTMVYPQGVTLTFTYTSGKLTKVANGLTRELNFTYTGDKLTGVTAGSRSVSFAYTGDNLVTATDPDSKNTTYVYDIPGRMTQMFRPANPSSAIMTNVYDALGRIRTQTDGAGNTWTYYFAGWRSEEENPANASRVQYFDSDGNVTLETDALGNDTKMSYDGLGRLIEKVFDEGNRRLFTYDANDNVLTVTDKPKPGSVDPDIVKTFTYHATFSKVLTETDGLGNVTTYQYNATTGTLTKKIFPTVDGIAAELNFTYNARGQVLTITDQTGMVTAFVYSGTNETLTSVKKDSGTGKLNLLTQFAYSTAGDVTTLTDPRGYATTFTYDNVRRLKQITPPSPFAANITKYTYDANGNRTKVERYAGAGPVYQTINATYTVDNLLATLTDPSSHVTTMTYNSLRKLWKRTDALSRITTFAYDQVGRLSTVTDTSGTLAESRAYTANGLLASMMDQRSKTTTFEYDGFDRLKKRTFADATIESFTHDKNGNVLTKVTRKGDTITSTFDGLNRLRTKAPAGMATVTYAYDLANRLLSAQTPVVSGDPSTGKIEFTYDAAGRRLTEKYPDAKTVTNQLDANGNVTKITYPGGYYVSRTYDQLNRLTQIKLNGAGSAALTFGYDVLGRRTSLGYGNGTSTAYTYSLDDMLTALTQTFSGSSVAYSYGYDAAHELTSQGVTDSNYMRHPSGGGTVNYGTANDVNEYPTVAGVSQTYNANGCLTGDGVWTFGYDNESHLTSAVKTGVNVAFSYDALGRQTQKDVGGTKTRYIYSGFQRLAEYNTAGSLTSRFVYGDGMDEPLIVLNASNVITAYLHHDSLGSIVATSNTSGTVTNKNKYMPWGEGTVTGTTFGFTGQRYDSETDLYYFKNRYYSPTLGRFLQPDPVLFDDSLNTYQYARNNPLSLTDPFGLSAESIRSVAVVGGSDSIGMVGSGGAAIAPTRKVDVGGSLDSGSGCSCACGDGGGSGGGSTDGNSVGNGNTGSGTNGGGDSVYGNYGDGNGNSDDGSGDTIYFDGLDVYNRIGPCVGKCVLEGGKLQDCIFICFYGG